MSVKIGQTTVIDNGNFDEVTVVVKEDAFLLKDSNQDFVISEKTGKPVKFKTEESAESFSKKLIDHQIKERVEPKQFKPTEDLSGYLMTSEQWLAHAQNNPPTSVTTMMIDGVNQRVVFDFCYLPHTRQELEAQQAEKPNRFSEYYLKFL